MGTVKTVFHRVLPTGKQGCVTVSKTTDGKYFASILFDLEPEKIVAKNPAIGVDLGLKDFAITSEGEKHNQTKPVQRKLKSLNETKNASNVNLHVKKVRAIATKRKISLRKCVQR